MMMPRPNGELGLLGGFPVRSRPQISEELTPRTGRGTPKNPQFPHPRARLRRRQGAATPAATATPSRPAVAALRARPREDWGTGPPRLFARRLGPFPWAAAAPGSGGISKKHPSVQEPSALPLDCANRRGPQAASARPAATTARPRGTGGNLCPTTRHQQRPACVQISPGTTNSERNFHHDPRPLEPHRA